MDSQEGVAGQFEDGLPPAGVFFHGLLHEFNGGLAADALEADLVVELRREGGTILSRSRIWVILKGLSSVSIS